MKLAIANARQEAEALAQKYAARAALPGASDVDKVRGETALMIIQYFEADATQLHKDLVAGMIADLLADGSRFMDELTEEVVTEFDHGNENIHSGPIKEAIDHAMAKLDVKQSASTLALDRHALKAWLTAVDELTKLDQPASAVSTSGPTFH